MSATATVDAGELRKVSKRATVRALCFAPNGQRCETWLPTGTYRAEGICQVSEGRDSPTMLPAVKLSPVNPKAGDPAHWYVGVAPWQALKLVAAELVSFGPCTCYRVGPHGPLPVTVSRTLTGRPTGRAEHHGFWWEAVTVDMPDGSGDVYHLAASDVKPTGKPPRFYRHAAPPSRSWNKPDAEWTAGSTNRVPTDCDTLPQGRRDINGHQYQTYHGRHGSTVAVRID